MICHVRALLAIALVVAGCHGSAADHLANAEGALAAGNYPEAQTEAAAGLALHPDDKATRWRLELAQLEGQARAGDAASAAATLERLAAEPESRVQSSHYVSTADQLRAAGQSKGAIEVLDQGLDRFPNDAALTTAIEQAKTSGGADELEALKSLGYLGD